MMEKWTETDEKNLFITRMNNLNSVNEKYISMVTKATNGEIRLKNFGKKYQDKTIELEKQFKEHGMSYFSNNWARRAIENYFSIEALELTGMLEVINQKLNYLNILYLNNTTTNLANKLLERLIRFYNQKVDDIENFSLENNLKDILSVILTDDRYYMYNRGDFINFYNEMLETMTTLGLRDNFLELDGEIRLLVIAGENKLTEFENAEVIEQARRQRM